MKLEQLQNDFIAAIFNQDRETALQYVDGDDTLDAAARLGIYRGSVHGILTQSLGDVFPVCKQLLGEEFFDKMCDYFIDKYPPNSPFFTDFGNQFSHFLSEFDPVKSVPFIQDIANFEWLRQKTSQQKLSEPFDFSQIETLNETQQANIVFHLDRSLHLIQSAFRIDLIWFAHQENSDIALDEIDIHSESKLLMWKRDKATKVENLALDKNTDMDKDHNLCNLSFNDNDYWDFLSAVAKEVKITELASNFGDKFPELLNKSIVEGRIESFTCE